MSRKPRRPAKLSFEGLHARAVRPRGPKGEQDGRWYWRVETWVGQGKQSRTVWSGWGSRDEVRQRVATLVAEHGAPTAVPKASGSTVTTVRDLLEFWTAHVEDRVALGRLRPEARGALRPQTGSSYETCAKRMVRLLGDLEVSRMTEARLEDYRDGRLQEGAAPGTIDLECRVLRVAWRWGLRRGLVTRDLVPFRVKGGRVRNHRTPTRRDVALVLGQLDGWAHLAVLLMASTGARIGEIANLRWGAVDLDRSEATLEGKTGPRLVPLPPHAIEALRESGPANADDYVLGVKPKTATMGLQSKHLPKACEAAGVPRFTPHGLRRHAVDEMMRAGVDPGTAAAFLGHSPEVMLRAYRKATMEDKRTALARARLGVAMKDNVLAFPSTGASEAD